MDVGFQLLLVAVMIFASFYFGIFLHECGHLLGALLVGWQPLTFSVGTGRLTTVFRRGDLYVKLGWRPSGGMVIATANSASFYRLKWFVFAISGPLVNFALAWGFWQVVKSPAFFSRVPSWEYTLLVVAMVMQAILFFGTALPHTAQVYGRQVPSDGLQIWRSLTMPAQMIPQRLNARRASGILVYLERGEEARALKAFEEMCPRGDWPPLQIRTAWIQWLFLQKKKTEAEKAMETLLGEAGNPGFPRGEVLDVLASVALYCGHADLRERALGYIDEALRESPSTITFKGTKGSLLVEEGKYEEGLELLDEVMAHTESENDRAICSYYIALALLETGRKEEGTEFLLKALHQFPDSPVFPHVDRRIRERRLLEKQT